MTAITRRLVSVYWDVVSGIFRDDQGAELRVDQLPVISYKEAPLLNITLVVNEDMDPYVFPAGLEYKAVIDRDFLTPPVMVLSGNALFNLAGEWDPYGTAGTADPSRGELSVALDANTVSYLTKIGTEAAIGAWLEIQGGDGVHVEHVFRMPFRCLGLVDATGSQPPTNGAFVKGTKDLVMGESYVEVTGLNMDTAPTQVLVTIRKPLNTASNLFGTVRDTSITADGFIVDLQAPVPDLGYKMDYIAMS